MCFAVLFTMTVTIPRDFHDNYGFTVAQAGYVQLASGVGMLVSTFVMGQYNNHVYRVWKDKRNGVVVPEDRLKATWPAIITIVWGCLMLGWSLVAQAHWAVPAFGAVVAGFGTMAFSASTNAYLIDLFMAQASSIIASANFLRFTLASVGPLIVYPFQAAAGSGWLYTFWAGMNILAYVGLLWVVYRGTRYRLALEPWKSGKTAQDQLRAIGALAPDPEHGADDESIVVREDGKTTNQVKDV